LPEVIHSKFAGRGGHRVTSSFHNWA
jgi:hypothetical protein